LTTAHLGLVCLYLGDRRRAEGTGRWLARLLTLQPDSRSGLFLRLDRSGHVVRDIPQGKAAFYLVSTHEPNQAYFMIGCPIAFLAKLYEATADEVYLNAARDYLEFGLSCEGNLRSSPTSHKVAWGAAVLARITSDPRCTELAVTIADHLLGGGHRTQPGVVVGYHQAARAGEVDLLLPVCDLGYLFPVRRANRRRWPRS
jgi:hypothetical protein